MSATLHYIYDPYCGWCYAAAPLLSAAQAVNGLQIRLHGGGMMAGARRTQVSPALRDYVIPHDLRIAQLTGQVFGENYFEGLLRDSSAVFDSAVPITAILAAPALGVDALNMLKAIQHAHYAEGQKVSELGTLSAIAAQLGAEQAAFHTSWHSLSGSATEQHIQDSRRLLTQLGGGGFPTLALEQDGQLQRLDISSWLGKAEAFQQWLKSHSAAPSAASGAFCSIDGC
ncbi:DsbA family protein [Undibacterium rugosum]|uniref:DsbA family protein n=1 Tax=Undibacterium rugosum TaxID=2762291 RepID=UPI001B82A5D4|nr:DsbA family protein [Undibacterium rugosum]MBR7777169.1 DsbA family protein [Undibacterium rugosum]